MQQYEIINTLSFKSLSKLILKLLKLLKIKVPSFEIKIWFKNLNLLNLTFIIIFKVIVYYKP